MVVLGINDDDGKNPEDNAHDETVHIPDWDPFGDVEAHDRFPFPGKVAFIRFGPSSQFSIQFYRRLAVRRQRV